MKKQLFLMLLAVTLVIAVFGIIKFGTGGVNDLAKTGQAPTNIVKTLASPLDGRPNDFVHAAQIASPCVVHVKSKVEVGSGRFDYYVPDPFREFFDDEFWKRFFEAPEGGQKKNFAQAAGSGVIISKNGHIVTNNHVIDQAREIEIVLHDQRSYPAHVVGTDPSTDLALLQIKEDDLPFIHFGNSDDAQVGEWVLAVGNPFYNLSSTVTAGIISAKARNINILQDNAAIESFIQTDAAVNRGNSGGALVDMEGALIGINTAIASPTGVYAGYAFAIPANIVEKVVRDIMEYGVVQRAYLGVFVRNLDGKLIEDLQLDKAEGVLVDSLTLNGAAARAGIKAGDIILAIDGQKIKNASDLQAKIGTHKPGDQIRVKIFRDGDNEILTARLRNVSGGVEEVKKERDGMVEMLGAEFRALTNEEKMTLKITNGVQVTRLYSGKLKAQTDMEEGFIITKIDNKKISTTIDLTALLKNKKGGVLIEGILLCFRPLKGRRFMIFKNRYDAAARLGKVLQKYAGKDGVVAGLPRGGVPLAYYLAKLLNYQMAVIPSKKIGHPFNKEYAIGAVTLEGRIVKRAEDIPGDYIESETKRLRKILAAKEQFYGGGGVKKWLCRQNCDYRR